MVNRYLVTFGTAKSAHPGAVLCLFVRFSIWELGTLNSLAQTTVSRYTSVMALLFKREGSDQSALGNNLAPLVIALLVLVSVGMLLGGALFFIRRHRRGMKDLENQSRENTKNTRKLTIKAIPFRDYRRSYSEKQGLIDSSSPGPLTPDSIPEIRITFPEEEDAQGRRKSGRVVIVQVGEAGVGYVRPVPEENLPPYQRHDGFSSVDLDKIGGLKEKDRTQWV